MYVGDKDLTIGDFKPSASDKDGNVINVTADLSKVDFSKVGTYEVVLTATDGQTKAVTLTVKEKTTNPKDPTDGSSTGTTNGTSSTSVASKTGTTSTTTSKSLPNTGETNPSLLTIIGVMSLLVSGVYVLTLKRKRSN